MEINRAVGPLTTAGRRSRPEDVLEALQLHGLIRQRLQERLGIQEAAEEVELPEAPLLARLETPELGDVRVDVLAGDHVDP